MTRQDFPARPSPSAENRHRFLEMRGAKERLAEATRICASVMEVQATNQAAVAAAEAAEAAAAG